MTTISIYFDKDYTSSTPALNSTQQPTLIAASQDQLLAVCKAAGDSLRLDILRVLSVESFGVQELCHIFSMPQPGMSHHLKILASAGLLTTRREGNSIFYRRALLANQDALEPLLHSLFESIDSMPVAAAIQKGLKAIHKERANSSKEFFAKNADRLKENQDLIAAFQHYSGCVRDLISNENLSASATVVEVGPGESPLINQLAEQFNTLLAVDNAPLMLDKARQTLLPAFKDKVAFELHDIEQALSTDLNADLIVLNMVLHHMASPSQFFQTAAEHLKSEGRLLIIDLCPHDQDWARDICGDQWLGFEPTDLDNWALEAKLHKGQSAYLGLKNGFQVQVRLFQSLPATA